MRLLKERCDFGDLIILLLLNVTGTIDLELHLVCLPLRLEILRVCLECIVVLKVVFYIDVGVR